MWKLGEGSVGYVIVTRDHNELILESMSPVDGSPDTMTSYRTELSGILSVLVAIKTILEYSHGS